MASIRRRGKSWGAKVWSRKTEIISKSLYRKAAAERWAVDQVKEEAKIMRLVGSLRKYQRHIRRQNGEVGSM